MSHAAILTTCMDRLSFLEQALPTWLEFSPTDMPIVVACYDDDDAFAWTKEQALKHRRVWPLFVPASRDRPVGTSHFNKARALNRGLCVLSDARKSRALLLDADTLLTRPLPELDDHAGSMTIVKPWVGTRDLTGVLSAHTFSILGIGGFDEGMRGWGAEDLDLRLRLYLKAGVRRVTLFEDDLFRPLEHDDALRARHYAEKDLTRSARENMARSFGKFSDEERALVLSDPNVPLLLGSGAEQGSGERAAP